VVFLKKSSKISILSSEATLIIWILKNFKRKFDFYFFLLCSTIVKDTENTALNLKLCKKIFELGFHGGNNCVSITTTIMIFYKIKTSLQPPTFLGLKGGNWYLISIVLVKGSPSSGCNSMHQGNWETMFELPVLILFYSIYTSLV